MLNHRVRCLAGVLGLLMPLTFVPGCASPCRDDGVWQNDAHCDDELPADSSADEEADETDEEPLPPRVPDDDDDRPDPPDDGGDAPGWTEHFHRDADLDGFGTPEDFILAAPGDAPAGYVPAGGPADCDDEDPTVFPGAADLEPELCTVDADGDGFGAQRSGAGFDPGSDCDDDDALTFPGAAYRESEPMSALCMSDHDEDGYGDRWTPSGVAEGTDCNDGSPNTYPGAAELDDPFACMTDEDQDGYGTTVPQWGVTPGQDCEDGNPAIPHC